MPNRILKDSISTSATVDALSAEEEVFFYRLIVACDDYGLMDARETVLRSKLYPLKIDTISNADVGRWLARLAEVGLVQTYEVEGRPYLHLASWERHQQMRAQKAKYPTPAQALAVVINSETDITPIKEVISPDINGNQPNTDSLVIRIQSESESESESNHGAGVQSAMVAQSEDRRMWEAFVASLGRKPGTTSERGKWNRGIKEVRDAGQNADNVAVLVANYHTKFKNAVCNPMAIANNLSELIGPLQRAPPQSNGRAVDAQPAKVDYTLSPEQEALNDQIEARAARKKAELDRTRSLQEDPRPRAHLGNA